MHHHGNLTFTDNAAAIQRAAKFNIRAFERVGMKLTSADDNQWSGALAEWRRHADSIRPYVSNIAAFYLYDEPYMHLGQLGKPVVYRRLQRAAHAVKQTFPGIPVAIAEAADDLTTDLTGRRYSVPSEVDWVGFDCYADSFFDCGTSHHSIPQFLGLLKAAIDTTRQKIFLIPPSYYLVPATGSEATILAAIRQGAPCGVTLNCRQQDSLVALARDYWSLARSDRTIVAMVAFVGSLYEQSNALFLGALDMPRVRDAYDEIYASIPGNDAIPGHPYPSGAHIRATDGTTTFGGHLPGDTLPVSVQILDDAWRPKLGVNVECTPSHDSDLLWRTRPTGTYDPQSALFAWRLGPFSDHTYTLRCMSPTTGTRSVTFSARTIRRPSAPNSP
jgi:hypothetical protein